MAHAQSKLRLVGSEHAQISPNSREHIVVMAHDARQKMCSNVLNVHLIKELLPQSCPNNEMIASLLKRIVDASRAADGKLNDVQALILDHGPCARTFTDGMLPVR